MRWLFAAFAGGPIGAFSAACLLQAVPLAVPRVTLSAGLLLQWLIVAPVLEELAFRGWLHDTLLASRSGRPRFGAASVGPLTLANVLASLAFAICHLPFHSPWLAGAVFLPSLVFGRLKEIWGSVAPAIAVHAAYNLAFMAAFER